MPETATAPTGTEATKTTETTKATETKLPSGYRPGFDMPPQPSQAPEDDPNFKLGTLLARRGKKEEAKTETKTTETGGKTTETAEKKAETTDAKPSSNLADLIAKNLKFREPAAGKTEKKAEEGVKTDTKEVKSETKDTKAETKETKTVVTKKKAEPTVADHMRNAGEIAAAAASAAVTAAMPKTSATQTKTESPEDALQDDYKRDYETAKHLAAINSLYKDAPQRILREHARVEEYARGWEARNPGKAYDPEADEHEEFYQSIERPWSAEEFTDARADMIAEQKMAAKSAKLEEKQRAIEEREAKRELTAAAGQTVNTVAMLLAQNVDEAAHNVIKEPGGFAKLQENDPITADALVEALDALSPRIQTAIFVDDPSQRISFDAKKNPEQKAWLDYLFEKEAQYAGQSDDRGRLFASRGEFVKLPPAQQARRWYLTVDHLISEMVADTVTEVKERIQKEREKGKKIAAALGYVPKPEANGAGGKDANKSDATKTTDTKSAETTTAAETKPVSPSVGSGAKIDTQGEGVKTKHDDLWAKTGKILFGR